MARFIPQRPGLQPLLVEHRYRDCEGDFFEALVPGLAFCYVARYQKARPGTDGERQGPAPMAICTNDSVLPPTGMRRQTIEDCPCG